MNLEKDKKYLVKIRYQINGVCDGLHEVKVLDKRNSAFKLEVDEKSNYWIDSESLKKDYQLVEEL